MHVFIDPFTDYGFKRLFRWPQNKIVLIDFLNCIINPAHRIVNVSYLDTEQIGEFKENRKSVFDIYCEDESGNIFVIELQRIKETYFKDRSLYYSTIPMRQQAAVGDWNYRLKRTICVCIMDFVFENSNPSGMVHEVKLIDTADGKVFNDSLTFLYLEMPKFKKQIDEIKTRQDTWFFVINNLAALPEMPLSLQHDPVFKHLFMEARISNYSEEEAMKYIASMKERWDRYAEKQTARDEGRQEAIIERNAAFVTYLLQNTAQTVEQIADIVNAPISFVQEIKDSGCK